MADKTTEVKAPNPAVLDKAEAKIEANEDLNQREAKALADQQAIDRQRGYTEEEWLPGIPQFRSLITGHTISGPNAEREMRAHHAELGKHGIVDPRVQ